MEESENKHKKNKKDLFAEGLTVLMTTLNTGFKVVGSLLNQSQAAPSYHSFNALQQPHFGMLPDFTNQCTTQEYTFSEGKNLTKL